MLRKPSISIQPVMISPPVLLVVLVIERQQCAFLLYGLETPDPFDHPIPDCQICQKRVPGFVQGTSKVKQTKVKHGSSWKVSM